MLGLPVVAGGSRRRTASVLAGALAGIAGFVTFLLIHALWIVPIWRVAPVGLLAAGGTSAVFGAAYAELLPRLPPRPWTAFAVFVVIGLVLLPSVVIAELRGPILTIEGDGGGSLLVSGVQLVADFVVGLLGTATMSGAALGWLIGRSRRAAVTMALAGFALALGPGHNIPVLGGSPSVVKELMILAAVNAVAACVLVEAQTRLAGPRSPSPL